MKNLLHPILHRLLPVMSLLCLPLFGGYSPGSAHENLRLNEAQLVKISQKMAYQDGPVDRAYEFTLIFPFRDGPRDAFGFIDYRIYSYPTNFICGPLTAQGRCSRISNRIVARTDSGQRFINTINPGNGTYATSTTMPGYGRFYFDAGQTRVHDFYGWENPLEPWENEQYLAWIRRDLRVEAIGIETPGLRANPSGW